MKEKILLLVYFLIMNLSAFAQNSITSGIPYAASKDQIRPLRQLLNHDLQRELEKQLKINKKWERLIAKGKMAIGLVDISDSSRVKFARINGDVMMYAASLPKLAILLAITQSFEDGTLTETPEILHDMKIMISQSDNDAATRLIDLIGFEKIESVVTNPSYELYDKKRCGGLWVGKRYAQKGRRYPDPIKGLSHAATVTKVCRFYYLLAMGQLINRDRSIQMLEMMVDPEICHKFVNTLNIIVPDAKLYRKSGTWRQWHSDSVLVWGPVWRRYILVALIEDPDGEQILRDLIPVVEKILIVQSTKSATQKITN